jgi:hypothetical protein
MVTKEECRPKKYDGECGCRLMVASPFFKRLETVSAFQWRNTTNEYCNRKYISNPGRSAPDIVHQVVCWYLSALFHGGKREES